MAFSALVVALVYAGLVSWLRRRRGERLLTEAYAALALGFATLAVPLGLQRQHDGKHMGARRRGRCAWLGLRQKRNFPWLAGLALQWLAAGAYCLSLINATRVPAADELLLLNAEWLGAAILSFSGFALALIHDRHRPRFALPQLLFAWGTFWWLAGAVGQFDLATLGFGEWRFATVYLGVSSWRSRSSCASICPWPRLHWLIALIGTVRAVARARRRWRIRRSARDRPRCLPWTIYLLALGWALWSARSQDARSVAVAHLAGLWTIGLALTLQLKHYMSGQEFSQGWEFLGMTAPLALMSLGLWRRAEMFSWPCSARFENYRMGLVRTGDAVAGGGACLRLVPGW